jgi:hypothetical protein
MPVIYKPGLSGSEISYIESRLQRKLPEDYKDFLSRSNGLYLTEPDFGQLSLTSVDEQFVSFDRFFGLIPTEECNDLVSFNKEFIDELSFLQEVIAVGEDGGGNPYVIVGEPGREGVYYWDRTHLHEGETSNNFDIQEQGDCGNLFYFGKKFEDFYSLLIRSLGGSPQFIEEK